MMIINNNKQIDFEIWVSNNNYMVLKVWINDSDNNSILNIELIIIMIIIF